MLLCPLMWYGNAREHDMDFGQFCIMFRSIFLEGFARPLAGVRLILKNLVRKFRALGGELRLRSGVDRIMVEDGRADGRRAGRRRAAGGPPDPLLGRAWWRRCGCATTSPPWTPPRRAGCRSSNPSRCSTASRSELGYDRTIVFFNDSERFHWQKPEQDLCDVRTGVICSPNNYLYDPADGQLPDGVIRDHRPGQLRPLGGAAGRAVPPGEAALVRPDRGQSAVRFVPDYRARVIDTDMFTPTHDPPLHLARQRRRLRCAGETHRRHDAPAEPVPLRHRPGLRRHRRRDRQRHLDRQPHCLKD